MSIPIEQVQKYVVDGRLIWTMTTNGYKFYTWNLFQWCQTIGVKLCIFCADTESSLFFRREGVPCVLLTDSKQSQQTGISVFGSADFARWNKRKLNLLHTFTTEAKTLGLRQSFFLDGDIVLQENPWPTLDACFRATGATLLFQCDCSNDKEHNDEHPCSAACSGVIACDHTQETEKVQWLYSFVSEEWLAASQQDQPYIQKRLEKTEAPTAAILPRREFGNGTWQKSGKWKDGSWILLHYNYRVGDNKKAAMKADGHWKLVM